ncbi:MAG: NADH-quinone oxidoreductase subunit NuoN [Micrococcales bacterium]|nr:MAG: NADH-quinone oxidoreductase subunit NuoN [Micrococcales bacterium]PIE25813.1 MAG: NADH-quinone oxidoreductase subunit NuoN [Micrococcales bacterium]
MFTAPSVDWLAAWPVLAVLLAGVTGIVVEAFAPRWSRRSIQLALVTAGVGIALVGLVTAWVDGADRVVIRSATPGDIVPAGMLIDRTTLFLQGALLLVGALSLLLIAERAGGRLNSFAPQAAAVPGSSYERQAFQAKLEHTEIFPLAMFALGGMMVFASAADLLTMFVALEVFSLPLYIMCGLERRRRLLSQEAALKYFLLGAFSSAVFLFGVALIYAVTGTVSLPQLTLRLEQARGFDFANTLPVLVVGALFVLIGLLFKVGAVPFHSWTPDVYTGAPTPITGFMAAATKMAAFGALLRVLFSGLDVLSEMWSPMLIAVAVLTMVLGSLVAIAQTDVKRMLAYSSIAHAGFILTALVAMPDDLASLQQARSSVLFYLLAYGITTVAAFGLVMMVREVREDGSIAGEANLLSQWAGLGRTEPVFAAAFTVLLLAFAGIPMTSGFIGKFGVFRAAVDGGHAWLALLGVLCSAAAAFFYIRVVVLMYFSDTSARPVTVAVGPLAAAAISMGVVATLLLGVIPGPVLSLTDALVVAGP